MQTNPNELFDEVDSCDRVIAPRTRAEIHKNKLRHRAVHAIFFDFKNRILLQKRSASKDSYPLAYTTSCSGHVDSNETYEDALIRETEEELGVKLSLKDFKYIGKLEACEETGWEFTKVYACRAEMRFNPPADEVASLDWAEIKNFEADAKANPRKYTPSFLKVYEFFKSKCRVLD